MQHSGRAVACHLQAQNQLQEWKKAFAVIQQHMGTFLNKLPPYVWLTVLSQLTSRVCHSNMDVATVNNKILLRAALAYPQQVISESGIMTHQPGFTCQAVPAFEPWGYVLDGPPPAGMALSAQDLTCLHGAVLMSATHRP